MNRHANVIVPTRHPPSGDRRTVEGFDRVLMLAAIAALFLTAASFVGRASWLLELLTHFRFQFAVVAVCLLAWALVRRKIAIAAIAAIAAAANAGPLIPYVMPGPVVAEASDSRIRLMSANVGYGNFDFALLRELIRRQDPDIVGLLEVDRTWLDQLAAIGADYPYQVLRPEEGAYGLALYSRVPVRELAASPYVEEGFQTAMTVELTLEREPVTLMLTHVRAPMSPGKAHLRNVQLQGIAEILNGGSTGERILIGDLNTTPWSPYYRQLEAATNMTNAARGTGYQPTWPFGLSLFGIPIDHCLVSNGLRVRQFRTGSDFGSDHLPIIIDIATVADGDVHAREASMQPASP